MQKQTKFFVASAVASAFVFTRALSPGPDFDRYRQWAKVFKKADPFQILGDGFGLSSQGVPFSQWSHGPGLFLLVPFSGLISAVLFWFFLWKLLERLAPKTALLGLATALLATPLGFYSLTHSAESFAITLFAGALLTLTKPQKFKLTDQLLVGSLAAGLLLIKLQNVTYASLLCLWALSRSIRETRALKPALKSAVLLAGPCLIAIAQTFWVHSWMTGSPLVSPYAFGDELFRSLDVNRLATFSVLFHPWHGTLAYHPWFILGIGSACAVIWKTPKPAARGFLSLVLGAIGINLFILAAWYCWWLGLNTFGQRGLILAYVPLVILFSYSVTQKNKLVVTLVTLCATWSYLLMRQGTVPQFYTWPELLRAQGVELARLALSLLPILVVFALVSLTHLYSRVSKIPSAKKIYFLLICLTADWLLSRLNTPVRFSALRMTVAVGLVTTLVLLYPKNFAPRLLASIKPRAPKIHNPALVATLTLLIGFNLIFLRTALVYESTRTEGPVRVPVHFAEVEATLKEYERVPGFKKEKQALREFIDRAKTTKAAR